VTAATLAWDAAYPIAYTHGYTTLADRAAAASEALRHHPDATTEGQQAAARHLVEIVQSIHPRLGAAPPAPRRVLELAAIAAMDRLDGRTAPEAITQAVHREAVKEGGMHGALTAADDIHASWRATADSAALVVAIGEMTLEQHVKASLATFNRDFITGWVANAGEAAATPVALAGASFAAPALANPVADASPPVPPGPAAASSRHRSRS
jgi:hypothetical protein